MTYRQTYHFTATLSLNTVETGLDEVLPNAANISMTSRDFDTLAECSEQCAKLLTEVALRLSNENKGTKYVLAVERHPLATNEPPRSDDWTDNMVAKVWLFDQEQAQPHVAAVGQGILYHHQAQDLLN
jgi:hypothetical protein